MSQDPASQQGEAPWLGAQWQPAPDVEPMPVQRHAADPLVPEWGLAEQGPFAAPPAPKDASPRDEPARRPDRTMVWVVGGAVLVGALVFAAIAAGGHLFAKSVEHQLDTVTDIQISTQLISAADALTLYRAQTGEYPADLTSLSQYGFIPDKAVTVQLVPTTGTRYCLAAGPAGKAPTAWFAGDGQGPTKTPCG